MASVLNKQDSNQSYVTGFLQELLAIPSPSGFCGKILDRIQQEAEFLGYSSERTPKQAVIVTVPGASSRKAVISGHVDTLGAMVRSIKPNGTLRLTPVGGYTVFSIENEYCTIHKRDGSTITGTIQTTKPSVHVFSDARDLKREESQLEVRLDAEVNSKEEVEALGIRNGDYISFDPRTVFTPSGYIKSRHLDDKAGVACLFGLLELLKRTGTQPTFTLQIMITSYEEVGHGASYLPPDVEEILAVDMGAMGDDLSCTEKDVSICAKDSSGPYDYELTSKLIRLAEQNKLDFAVDIYPYYGSDASASLRGGNNVRAALIGPGVQASHAMERTHQEALWNTIALLAAYVTEPEGH